MLETVILIQIAEVDLYVAIFIKNLIRSFMSERVFIFTISLPVTKFKKGLSQTFQQ
jgi:hypothetical protein